MKEARDRETFAGKGSEEAEPSGGASREDEELDHRLRQLIVRVDSADLASIRGVLSGILQVMAEPRSSVKDLKELILVDPPLATKVLRVANSVYYGSPRPISEIDQAIIWIGFDALKEIVLTQKVQDLFVEGDAVEEYCRQELWKHSLAVALAMKLLFRREFGEKGDAAYSAGLVHDIGIIVEDQLLRDGLVQVAHQARTTRKSFTALEKKIFGFDHTDVGRALAHHWNLPVELRFAIGCHHAHHMSEGRHTRLAKALFITNQLAVENGFAFYKVGVQDRIVLGSFADDLGLTSHGLQLIAKGMVEEMRRIEDKGVFGA